MVSICPLWMVHRPHSWALLLPSNLDTCHQFSPHWKKILLISSQSHHAHWDCHWHNYSNRKMFNCSIEKNQQKSSTATIWYDHMQGTFPNLFHLLQWLFCTKTTTSPTFKLPRVFTIKPISAPPRVSPSTAQNFHNISPTTKKHCRYLRADRSKASPKTSHLPSP